MRPSSVRPGRNWLIWQKTFRKLGYTFKVCNLKDLALLHQLTPTDNVIYNRKKDLNSATGVWFQELLKADPWYKDVVPNFKPLPAEELPAGMDSASSFTSVCINTAIYLPWLASQCLKNGVRFRRGIAKHIKEAAGHHHSGKKADLIVNCTGLGSHKLGGVEDKTLTPARGQIVVVRNDPGVMASNSGSDDGEDEVTYIMHRAAGKPILPDTVTSSDRSRWRLCPWRMLSEG